MKIRSIYSSFIVGIVVFISSCSVAPTKAEVANTANSGVVAGQPAGATIEIKPGSPSETVKAFYGKLRERKIREAIFLTNLRPAIEGLTDDELKEFAVDFEAIAKIVPEVIQINGEIISGDIATVTANLPDDENEKLSVQQIRLRKDADVWVILSADEEAEKKIKKEGKNYFAALRIETHQDEAKKMLDRIAKAEMVYSMQNGGNYTEFAALIADNILPADVNSSESTGYNYVLKLGADMKSYRVDATPAVYGKSGKLSYMIEAKGGSNPAIKSGDNGGKPISK